MPEKGLTVTAMDIARETSTRSLPAMRSAEFIIASVRRALLVGTASRQRLERLGEKLLQIREALGLSQNEMIRHLGLTETITRNNLSLFELGKREPSLIVLLKYARAAGVCLHVLVDDPAELPKKLPAEAKHPLG